MILLSLIAIVWVVLLFGMFSTFFPNTFILVVSKLGLKEGVILEDDCGEEYYTFAHETPWGRKVAYVYPFSRIGHVELLPGGVIREGSYVKRWKKIWQNTESK